MGQRDQMKEIADGYAMNALIPKGLAVQATASAIAAWEERKKKEVVAQQAASAQYAAALEKLAEAHIVITAKANEKGHLYEQLGADAILAAVQKECGVALPSTALRLPAHIKTVGEYEVEVRLGERSALMKIVVQRI